MALTYKGWSSRAVGDWSKVFERSILVRRRHGILTLTLGLILLESTMRPWLAQYRHVSTRDWVVAGAQLKLSSNIIPAVAASSTDSHQMAVSD